jgi:hypothetical protein
MTKTAAVRVPADSIKACRAYDIVVQPIDGRLKIAVFPKR